MDSTTLKTRAGKEQHQCLWMQAGVVRKKLCQMDYGCTECRFDRALKRVSDENRQLKEAGREPEGKSGGIVSWKERLNVLPLSRRPCLHHMKGRIEFRTCNMEYRCGHCEFDQYFDDQYAVRAVVRPVDVLEVKGFRIPQGYYFHRSHTWAKIEEGSSVRVGLDEFALRLLGPLDRIEAPLVGKEVVQGRGDISVARGEYGTKIPSPVSGVVTSINPALREKGSLANKEPFSGGWIMRIHSKRLRRDLKGLMINNETGDFIGHEVERLYELIEETGGPLAVDGGYLGDDIFGNMPQLGWERITGMFF
ncbi:MAG: glycine cleavage system protein H [Deltaproteobacteria bacterium]|nr:glycine cleavage system protein H [Deltaproteobacteria bacterium]